MDNIYILKKIIDGELKPMDNPEMEVIIPNEVKLDFSGHSSEAGISWHLSQVDILKLDKISYDYLVLLLEHFGVKQHIGVFLNIIPEIQDNYNLYAESLDTAIFNDFVTEQNDVKVLFDFFESYLKRNKDSNMKIVFKIDKYKPYSISNFFLTEEILSNLLKIYGITYDNFDQRKREVLQNFEHQFQFDKGAEVVIMIVIKTIVKYLKEEIPLISQRDCLRFAGVFLHICQIPTDNKADIAFQEYSIKDYLGLIYHQRLLHLYNQRKVYKK